MEKVFVLNGFTNSSLLEKLSDEINAYLANKYQIYGERYNYYEHYSKSSENVIINTADALINYAHNNTEVNVCAWSLGASILVEVLNLIELLNQQLDVSERININRIILLSPAFYILDAKNFLNSLVGKLNYTLERAKQLEHILTISELKYILENLKSLYHLFKISNLSKTGLDILGRYDTTCFIPTNDKYVNSKKIIESLANTHVPVHILKNNLGHAFPLNKEAIDEVIQTLSEKQHARTRHI